MYEYAEDLYGSFAETGERASYNCQSYLDNIAQCCAGRADELLAGIFLRTLDRNMQNDLLISVASSMLGQRRLRLLDHGGGCGQSFVTVAAAIPNHAERIDYTMRDLSGSVARAVGARRRSLARCVP